MRCTYARLQLEDGKAKQTRSSQNRCNHVEMGFVVVVVLVVVVLVIANKNGVRVMMTVVVVGIIVYL